MRKCSTQRDAGSTTSLAIAVSIAIAAGLPTAARAQEQGQDIREEEGAAGEAPPRRAGTRPGSAATDLDTIVVTGTRIRGGTTPSPVITIGSERIREEGFADLGEVIRSIPQNFNGGQNPGVGVGATLGVGGVANQNITGGSSLNLRGLGPDATLTLLNGRRMVYGGMVNAVDISAIPLEAVERLEIVPDGASAIYGADAVGGVGNVVLKKDYQGAALKGRYGGAADGGLTTHEIALTAGTTWTAGGLIATYKDVATDPIYARQRDYTSHMFDPNTLYPESHFQGALLSAYQSVADMAEIRIDAFKSVRKQEFYLWNTGLLPYYNKSVPRTETSFVAPALQLLLPNDWALSIGGSLGKDEHLQHQLQANIGSGIPTTLLKECYCNEATSYEVGTEGPLFAGRLAAGAGVRRNRLVREDHFGSTQAQAFSASQRSRFAYAEFALPLLQDGPSKRRLELTAAVRRENDDNFGSVSTPKLGMIYGPSKDFTIKYSWGKSFKSPTMLQMYLPSSAVLRPASTFGGQAHGDNAKVISLSGGSRDLQPERATTRAISLSIHPEAWPTLNVEASWFDIDYRDRVVQPITDYGRAMMLPEYAQFFEYAPTAARVEEVIDSASVFYNLVGSFNPGDVVAVMHTEDVNAARQRIRGVDVSASYRVDTATGGVTVRADTSWLDSRRRNFEGQPDYDVAGVLFNPARINGRLGLVWENNGWMTSFFSNYTSGVEDRVARSRTSSFTTLDFTSRYASQRERGLLSGTEISLSVQNIFDRAPPLYASAMLDQPPYDSVNYSSIGRFASLTVSKQW